MQWISAVNEVWYDNQWIDLTTWKSCYNVGPDWPSATYGQLFSI